MFIVRKRHFCERKALDLCNIGALTAQQISRFAGTTWNSHWKEGKHCDKMLPHTVGERTVLPADVYPTGCSTVYLLCVTSLIQLPVSHIVPSACLPACTRFMVSTSPQSHSFPSFLTHFFQQKKRTGTVEVQCLNTLKEPHQRQQTDVAEDRKDVVLLALHNMFATTTPQNTINCWLWFKVHIFYYNLMSSL